MSPAIADRSFSPTPEMPANGDGTADSPVMPPPLEPPMPDPEPPNAR